MVKTHSLPARIRISSSWSRHEDLGRRDRGEDAERQACVSRHGCASYELDKTGKDASYGSFVASSTGIHGWYFKNNSDKDIKFHLIVAGLIVGAKMYAGGLGEDVPIEDAK